MLLSGFNKSVKINVTSGEALFSWGGGGALLSEFYGTLKETFRKYRKPLSFHWVMSETHSAKPNHGSLRVYEKVGSDEA